MAIKILWIDDEIDLLKPHRLFLEKKGYETEGINNATDALERIKEESFAAVLLDENMPGVGGLDALVEIKKIKPSLPIIMVTKSEEEHIMEEAIGKHIADYLIKPINPNQILLSLKKILDSNKIITETTVSSYQQDFRQISIDLMQARDYEDWANIYRKLVHWEVNLENIDDENMLEILSNQKNQANNAFTKFIEKNYKTWLHGEPHPIMSHTIFKERVRKNLDIDKNVLLIMIDNLRYDQWKTIEPLFTPYFNNTEESLYYSILPSSTQYARNAFFSGLLPSEIEKRFPDKWLNDPEEGNKNMFEHYFMRDNLARLGLKDLSTTYYKILNSDFEKGVLNDFHKFKNKNLTCIVYNFIDILSHAKTDNRIVKEMIRDDKTYRSVTKNWFENSYLLNIVKQAAEEGMKVIITTDHGTILVKEPSKVVGDRETSTNIRYKMGRNLQYNPKEVFCIENPEEYFLPKSNMSSKYVFATNNNYLIYPKRYNHYVNYFKDTYQHGGVSLEEMIIPFIELS